MIGMDWPVVPQQMQETFLQDSVSTAQAQKELDHSLVKDISDMLNGKPSARFPDCQWTKFFRPDFQRINASTKDPELSSTVAPQPISLPEQANGLPSAKRRRKFGG